MGRSLPGSSFNPAAYPLGRHEAKIARAENAEETPTPPWLAWCDKGTLRSVPVMQEGKTAILVIGDANRNKTMCVPGGFATVRIDLPRNWDKLMERKGYAPLSSFYQKSSLQPRQPRANATRYRRR